MNKRLKKEMLLTAIYHLLNDIILLDFQEEIPNLYRLLVDVIQSLEEEE